MSYARPQLAAAVLTVLAVTACPTVLTAPAYAVQATESTTQATTTSVAPFPKNSTILGATASGYLTKTTPNGEDPSSGSLQWVPADGSPATVIDWAAEAESTGSGDVVAFHSATEADLTDMGTGQKLLSVPVDEDNVYVGAAGKALFTHAPNQFGDRPLHMHTATGGAGGMTAGLPGDAWNVKVTAGTARHALVTYSSGATDTSEGKKYAAALDLATNTVTETYELPRTHGDLAISATHLAWIDYDWSNDITVVDRVTKESQKFEHVGDAPRRDVEVGLVGGWVTYGTRSGLSDWTPDPLSALTARSLKDGTTRKLLDHTLAAAVAPDGALTVRGGTAEQGEGLYRIAPGTDETPTAALVAASGEPTKVTLLSAQVPAVMDLDEEHDKGHVLVPLEWKLSRPNVRATVTLRHVRTGKVFTTSLDGPRDGVVSLNWGATLDNGSGTRESAYNGDYTWEIGAEPRNGIGPTLNASGTFTIIRKPAPHDFNDNGSPDVLLRDGSGRLWRADSRYDDFNQVVVSGEQKVIGTGWSGYNQIEAAGDVAGAPHADIVARDTAGVLWLYLGNGDGTFATRYKISSDWGGYTKIAAGSDLDDDGEPDLVATDAAGAMWLYKGTGSWRTPYTSRVKIGTGWHGYNQITATGNIAGAPAGDLVARDPSGVLWLYLGKGDGTFASRVMIGSGWGGYSHIIGIGDANTDGRPDLLVTNAGDTATYLYKGTGSWSKPFGDRKSTGLPNNWPTSVA
ncbi:FG-GAP repeat domain-containing protein [Streptomyces sp. NPDC059567]|uniref:FG-GAP repeat domain-containing protein n=1 Tax=Streptomyces sp. NPDC059567 TaxID=3346867 RepID=UPI0036A12E03